MKKQPISQRIEGTSKERMLKEFLLNSGLFQILLLTYIASSEGITNFVKDPQTFILLGSAFLQTWIIERWGSKSGFKNALFLLIAPTAYTVLDVAREGWFEFQSSPYHVVYWAFSLLLALFTLWRSLQPSLVYVQTVLTNILRVLLIPALYFVVEMYSGEIAQVITPGSFAAYWVIPGHAFLLASSMLFGLLLGMSEASSNRSFELLQQVAMRLHDLTGWSFDRVFTESVVAGVAPMSDHRARKIILFMDIRGFTKWSEEHDLHEITETLSSYYEAAEQIILNISNTKPQFTGDEVMTWFTPDSTAFEHIQLLQAAVIRQLKEHGLTVGIGVHCGEVIEGVIGSSTTKAIRITGDPVNTCARICSAALPGELLLSQEACEALSIETGGHAEREIIAKGKQNPLKVFSFSHGEVNGA